MPFGDPILAGDELIRNAMRSENFTENEGENEGLGWIVRRDGSAVFNSLETRGRAEGPQASYNELVANESFIYKGDELEDRFTPIGRGVVGFHERFTTSVAAPQGVEAAVMRLYVPTVAGRVYKITMDGGAYASNSGDDVHVFIRFTNDGSEPTFTSPIHREIAVDLPYGAFVYFFHSYRFIFGNGLPYKAMMTFRGTNPGNHYIYGSTSCPSSLFIEDVGTVFPYQSGIDDNGAAVPPKTYREFFTPAYDSRGYKGDGTLLSAANGSQFMHSGDIGVDGNRRSACWFDYNVISALIGVPLADINYCDVYVYYDHWYYNNGGNAYLGHHESAGVTNTQPPGAYATQFQSWEGRDIGKWISIKNNATMMNALRAGTFRGLTLGATPSASLVDYGYAVGYNNGSNIRPHIRAGYYK